MTIDSAMLAAADAARTAFGEDVTYHPAEGNPIALKALIDRGARSTDLGELGAPVNSAEVSVRRTDLNNVVEGRDRVTLRWVDGVQRTARVQVIIKVSRGLWRLGVTL